MALKVHRPKSGRYRYFQLYISPAASSPINSFWASSNSLFSILENAKFISRNDLEKVLYELEIKTGKQENKILKFEGQLERDPETGRPYWNILVKTKSATTPRLLSDSLAKSLKMSPDSIKQVLEICPQSDWKEVDENKNFLLKENHNEHSLWFPGYLSDTIMYVSKMLQNHKILKAIEHMPEHFPHIVLKDETIVFNNQNLEVAVN